jgi:hypothetical protein
MTDRTFYRLALPASISPGAFHVAVAAFWGDPWTPDEIRSALTTGPNRKTGTFNIDMDEHPTGEARQLADAILGALDRARYRISFAVAEDPYVDLGTLVRYQPGRGIHETPCGGGAEPLLTATRAAALLAAPTPSAATTQLRAELGLDWDTPRVY